MTDIIANIEEVQINATVEEVVIDARLNELTIDATISENLIINNAPFNPSQDEWDNFVLSIMN